MQVTSGCRGERGLQLTHLRLRTLGKNPKPYKSRPKEYTTYHYPGYGQRARIPASPRESKGSRQNSTKVLRPPPSRLGVNSALNTTPKLRPQTVRLLGGDRSQHSSIQGKGAVCGVPGVFSGPHTAVTAQSPPHSHTINEVIYSSKKTVF